MLGWAGLRGAVPVVLATFPVIAEVPGSRELFNIVFFAVLVSTILQGTTFEPLAARLGVTTSEPALPRPLAEGGTIRRLGAEILEYPVADDDAIVGHRVRDLGLPRDAVVNVIVRDDQAIPPRGTTRLRAGDRLHVLIRQESARELYDIRDRWHSGPIGRPPRPRPAVKRARGGLLGRRVARAGRRSRAPGARSARRPVIEQLRIRRDEPGGLCVLEDGRYAVTGPLYALGTRLAVSDWARRRMRSAERGREGVAADRHRGAGGGPAGVGRSASVADSARRVRPGREVGEAGVVAAAGAVLERVEDVHVERAHEAREAEQAGEERPGAAREAAVEGDGGDADPQRDHHGRHLDAAVAEPSSSRWIVSRAIAAAKMRWSRLAMHQVSTPRGRATRGPPSGRVVRIAAALGSAPRAERGSAPVPGPVGRDRDDAIAAAPAAGGRRGGSAASRAGAGRRGCGRTSAAGSAGRCAAGSRSGSAGPTRPPARSPRALAAARPRSRARGRARRARAGPSGSRAGTGSERAAPVQPALPPALEPSRRASRGSWAARGTRSPACPDRARSAARRCRRP